MPHTPLQSLTDFKRALTLGSEWQFRWRNGSTESPWTYRQVVHVQSNAVAFAKSPDALIVEACRLRPHGNASWLWHPKASHCTFTRDGIISIGEPNSGYVIEYRRQPAETAQSGEAA